MTHDDKIKDMMLRISDRETLQHSTESMRVVTTVGALHKGIRAVLAKSQGKDHAPYTYAAAPRGLHGNGRNSYPPQFKAEILERLPYCNNDSALAREFGISNRTVARWRERHGIPRTAPEKIETAAVAVAEAIDEITPLFEDKE
jgi:transposase-like protein